MNSNNRAKRVQVASAKQVIVLSLLICSACATTLTRESASEAPQAKPKVQVQVQGREVVGKSIARNLYKYEFDEYLCTMNCVEQLKPKPEDQVCSKICSPILVEIKEGDTKS